MNQNVDNQSEPVAAFTVDQVSRVYTIEGDRIPVLKDVTFTVPQGEWVALVGRSGCGKTTLLLLLGSLDRPTAGSITCLGQPYRRLSGRRKALLRRDDIGFVFQSYHLFPELSAVENVMLPAMQWGWDRRRAQTRARQILAEFGLDHRLRHRPRELSGGEQQRVAIARALINDPKIILADEPTGNLDATAGAEIVTILSQLHHENGKTIVMVTHDRTLAGRADRVFEISGGAAVPLDRTAPADTTA